MNLRAPGPAMKVLLVVVVATTLRAASPLPAATGQERSWDRYRILTERNMFRRDRRSVRSYEAATTQPSDQPTHDSDGSIALTGIARRDGEFVAFFEDTRINATIKARVGQPVGKGNVEQITLNEVEYRREGTIKRIGIGRSLMGTTATMLVTQAASTRPDSPTASRDEPTTRPAESAATTGPAPAGTSPKGTTDSNISETLQRMRRRREQELRR